MPNDTLTLEPFADNARSEPSGAQFRPNREQSSPVLAVESLSVRYAGGALPALSDVILRVGEGEFVALLGANGAGKSTLLRAVAALVVPSRGKALVMGRDVQTVGRRALARMVSLVPQSERASAGFRVREVVAMGRAAHQGLWMLERAADAQAVDEAMAQCDLGALSTRTVETLSGGEQRRVAIARALAQKPRLLLLDEPAAFLDLRHRLELYERLAEVTQRSAVAVVAAMHDLDTAARFASRVVLMRGGHVVGSGSPGEVMDAVQLGHVLGADLSIGTDQASGNRYFVPLRSRPE